jgi:hypothetical protein
LVIFSGRDAPIQPLIYHLLALKIALNHLKMLKVKLQKSPKYSHFRILLKAAERLGIFSIPVRVTSVKARKQRNIAVFEFLFSAHFGACPLFVRYCSFW